MPVFGPGTLTIGEIGTEIDVSCLVNNAMLSASPSTSDPTTKLCGTQKPGNTTYTATLSGNMDIDPDDPDGIFCLSWANPGAELPFTFVPNSEVGTSASGTLTLQPLDFGSNGAFGDDMTADFEFQVLWKPTIDCAAAPVASTGATAGTPGSWTPSGSAPPANAAGANTAGITANPNTAWTTGQYVQGTTAGTGGRMYWDGSTWQAGTAA